MRCSRRPLSAASPESATGHGDASTPGRRSRRCRRRQDVSLSRVGTSGIGRAADRSHGGRRRPVCASSGATPTARSGRVTSSPAGPGEVEVELADLSLLEGDAIPRGPDRRPPRSDRRARPQRRRASARVHAHRRRATGRRSPRTSSRRSCSRGSSGRSSRRRIPARVIFVASGGMYMQPLDVDALLPGPREYDGPKAYARCKRAQVALAEELTRRHPGSPVAVNAIIPGGRTRRLSGTRFRPSAVRSGRCCGQLLRAPTRSSGSQRRRRQPPSGASSSSTGGRGRSTGCDGPRRPDEAAEVARLWSLCSARADGEGRAP